MKYGTKYQTPNQISGNSLHTVDILTNYVPLCKSIKLYPLYLGRKVLKALFIYKLFWSNKITNTGWGREVSLTLKVN